ncbi:Alkyltransferase-like protein 1 [Cystobasidiomycetes sp. EMM_F5]
MPRSPRTRRSHPQPAPEGPTASTSAVAAVNTGVVGTEATRRFEQEVLEAIRSIPAGRVTSYGHIAKMAGRPKHSRMVGQILKCLPPQLSHPGTNNNPNAQFVPWHRVVNSKGLISPRGSVQAVQRQARLLQDEGITVNTGNFGIEANANIGLAVSGGTVNMREFGWFPVSNA